MGWIILLLFTLPLAYLMFAPIFIEIDSDRGWYGIRFHRLASARFYIEQRSAFIEIRIAGWMRKMDLITTRGSKKKETIKKSVTHKKKGIQMSTVKNIFRSFKINTLCVNIDTGDMAVNGILFPVFFLLAKRTGKEVRINFTGENRIILQIENNFARLAWAFIKYQK